MKELVIKIHSMTDLITNSSTVIYTYSDASLDACRKMIDEVFRVLGVDKKCDDVFDLWIKSDIDEWTLSDHEPDDDTPAEYLDSDGSFSRQKLSALFKQIHDGLTPPVWLNKKSKKILDEMDSPPSNWLVVRAKDKKFEKLADSIHSFLYSTNHEEGEG